MHDNHNPVDWGREAGICSRLVNKHSVEFLLWLEPPNSQKVQTMQFYFLDEGRSYVSDALKKYDSTPCIKVAPLQDRLFEALNNRDTLPNMREEILGFMPSAHPSFVSICRTCRNEYFTGYAQENELCHSCFDKSFVSEKIQGVNFSACRYFIRMNELGYNFQHGLSIQGEHYIRIKYRAYMLDAIDWKRRIIFEWDEPAHMFSLEVDLKKSIDVIDYFRNVQRWGDDFTFIRYSELTDEIYRIW